MNVAATDEDGIIVSIITTDDAWWAANKDAAIARIKSQGFEFCDIGPINVGEAERHVTEWTDFDAWVCTLQDV